MTARIPRARPVRRRRPKAPGALPKCSWQFWDEPDDTNRGPKIIVTEPSGALHYLIDLDTFHMKIEQRRKRQLGLAASYVETCRMAARTDHMSSFSFEKMDMYGDDDDSTLLSYPGYTPGHSSKWWQRWGRMLLRPAAQPRPLLPTYHQTASSSFDTEKSSLLGYDGNQDEKPHDVKLEAARSPGFVGALRDLACCCSKS